MLDVTKPMQTRDGRKARIICTDRKVGENGTSMIVLVEDGNIEFYGSRHADGRYYSDKDDSADIINVPVKHVAWFNAYLDGRLDPHGGTLYNSEEVAARYATSSRPHKQIKVEWEE